MDSTTINEIYGNKIRIRACGLLIKNDALLLIKHIGIGDSGYLWSPPGGGVEFNETIETALKREFKEECNLDINVNEFLYINEYIHSPLHAIELFYAVELQNAQQVHALGFDPETTKTPIITDLKYFNLTELNNSTPNTIHSSTLNWAKKNLI